MTQPRSTLINLEDTPYYHIVSRCVRRAFLCGFDDVSSKNFEHRRQWIVDRLTLLASAFSIDVASYAIMSNHFHLVLCIDNETAKHWNTREVLTRWSTIFRGPIDVQEYLSGNQLDEQSMAKILEFAETCRSRLSSISWFMRCLNEPIARMANKEDNCTGRFWEGRYKSQALLDDAALLTAMAYVDLNPLRAQMAETPEKSDYTSIQERIKHFSAVATDLTPTQKNLTPEHLMPFSANEILNEIKGIPFKLEDYLQLVDWSGRILRENKKGLVPENVPEILERLQIKPQQWHYCTTGFENLFKRLVGKFQAVQDACKRAKQDWAQGMKNCQMAFG